MFFGDRVLTLADTECYRRIVLAQVFSGRLCICLDPLHFRPWNPHKQLAGLGFLEMPYSTKYSKDEEDCGRPRGERNAPNFSIRDSARTFRVAAARNNERKIKKVLERPGIGQL